MVTLNVADSAENKNQKKMCAWGHEPARKEGQMEVDGWWLCESLHMHQPCICDIETGEEDGIAVDKRRKKGEDK